ncbi:putative glycoside hydrolase family 15 protein [Lentzea californiensis]|uniref:putative glycoside hydrolase family 15 protein n=1 Tax=Lentzea californiensis TaxID=438851 RepID=UPI002165F3EE|nr:putative glycoside hydrolase family 15 protein [Lentzea californiensis]MCR3753820.1 putative glycosyl hydrolase family 15 [Lentzea californiensis]
MPKALAPCAWWYGIGDSPTQWEIRAAAKHYDVVVLNAWETAAMRKLHELNPKVKVLVYKDFSSTRNYYGAVEGDRDARYLPTGIGYHAAERNQPGWFAISTLGQRIEWDGYPKHWQMTVWDPAYQQAWADAVVGEVLREGWDGVLADNDFSSLKYYSPAVIAGTADAAGSDRLLRDGLDAMLALTGDALEKSGKMLVPNVSESQLTPGRWSAHSRYAGAMEENFGLQGDDGTGELITFQGNQFKEQRAQAALGESWLLLITHTKSDKEERVGYASAALLASPHTCWTRAQPDYKNPYWSLYQDAQLGEAVETATRLPSGVWTRRYSGGWVAVNPTKTSVLLTPPPGLVTLRGEPVPDRLDLPSADAVVLVNGPKR